MIDMNGGKGMRRLGLILVGFLLVAGCGGSGGSQDESGQRLRHVTLQLHVDTPAPSQSPRALQGSGHTRQTNDPAAVTRLLVQVSAADIVVPISVEVRNVTTDVTTVELRVPLGSDRQITATAFNEFEVQIFQGQLRGVDLTQGIQTAALTLQALPSITPLVSALISAANGGVLSVRDPRTGLAGLRLRVPPGALVQDTVLSLGIVNHPQLLPLFPSPQSARAFTRVGHVLFLEPTGAAFLSPITLTLPYDEAAIQEASLDEGLLQVLQLEDGAAQWQVLAGETINAALNRLTVPLTSFSFVALVGTPATARRADLRVTSEGPAQVLPSTTFTYVVTVSNQGPNDATGVSFTAALTGGATLPEVLVIPTIPEDSCQFTTLFSVNCQLGTIRSGRTVTIELRVNTPERGVVGHTATVRATESDPDSTNNTASLTTRIVGSTLGELNRDGKPDVITSNGLANTISALLDAGISVGNFPTAVVSADLNGDGYADLVVANAFSAHISVLRATGDGTFHILPSFVAGVSPVALAVVDVHHDNRLDVVVADQSSTDVLVFPGNGDGTFGSAQVSNVGKTSYGVVVADFDEDGHVDMMTTNGEENTVSLLFGDGRGVFYAPRTLLVGDGPEAITVADVNQDTHPDVLVANRDDATVSVLFGLGSGGFTVAQALPVGREPTAVVATDGDADGILDIITANKTSQDVSLLAGRGDGTFAPAQMFLAEINRAGIVDDTLHGNGQRHMVTVNPGSNTPSILRHR